MGIFNPPEASAAEEEVPPYLGNGVLGLRVGRGPFGVGVCISSGLAGIVPGDRVEGFARAPFPIAGDLEVDSVALTRAPELARGVRRLHDFEHGELVTRFEFGPPGGACARATVITFCSRSMPMLALQEITVTVDRPCMLRLSGGIDPTGIGGRRMDLEAATPGTDRPVVDGILRWETSGALGSCGAAYTTSFEGGDATRQVRTDAGSDTLATSYSVAARPGLAYRLRQLGAVVNSQFHAYPHRQATRMASAGAERGWDELRRENRAAWDELWRSRVHLLGAGERWQRMADAAFYYLHSSAHPGSLFSTSMFGQAYWPNYHYYEGHVMWDIEAFSLMPILLTQPGAAHAILEYRFQRISGARKNAVMNGYAGLQFPWASGPLHGDEMIRTDAPLIVFEQHVNAAVAKAFADFWYVTGDADFMRERAWPVMEGIADWISSRVIETGRGAEILEALGPAEKTHPADNNAYVNLACAQTLRHAAVLARHLGRHRDATRWGDLANRIVVPRGEEGTILHHDGFRFQVDDPVAATPEILAAVLLFDPPLREREREEALRAELDRAGAYLGYPMLSALLGPAAAWLKDRRRARELFEAGYADYVHGPYWETDEFSRTRFPDRPPVGPFMANLGGFLTACMLWLPRLRPGPGDPAGWCTDQVQMPEGWDGVEIERLTIRGRSYGLLARHGDRRARLQ